MGALFSSCTLADVKQHGFSGSPCCCGEIDSLREFSFAEIVEATQNFSSELLVGEGGFGFVYRSISPLPGLSSAMKVSIKKLKDPCRERIPELKSEFELLGNLHHPHLVKIHGYCTENEAILINENVENGNLEQRLFGTAESALSWHSRVKVAYQVASAIEYLHANNIMVFNLKTANVLFEKDGNVKVSDFGLGRCVQAYCTHVSIQILAKLGYLDPEYFERGQAFQRKFIDVYSFGILLGELLTGRRASTSYDLRELIPNILREKKSLESVVDPHIAQTCQRDLKKFAIIMIHCTDENYSLRPLMSDIVPLLLKLLEGDR